MTAKSATQRKREQRQRLEAAGYRQLSEMVHRDDYERLRAAILSANRKRQKSARVTGP